MPALLPVAHSAKGNVYGEYMIIYVFWGVYGWEDVDGLYAAPIFQVTFFGGVWYPSIFLNLYVPFLFILQPTLS